MASSLIRLVEAFSSRQARVSLCNREPRFRYCSVETETYRASIVFDRVLSLSLAL